MIKVNQTRETQMKTRGNRDINRYVISSIFFSKQEMHLYLKYSPLEDEAIFKKIDCGRKYNKY